MSEEKKIQDTDSTSVEIIYNDAVKAEATESSCGGEASFGGKSSQGERRFTQDELDDLIHERLSREKRKNQALYDAKAIIDGLRERGIIKSASYSEAVSELEALISVGGEAAASISCKDGVGDCEVPTASEKEDSFEDSGESKKEGELAELLARYPQAAHEGIVDSAAFWKFRGAYPGSLSDAYGIYKSACGMNNDSATDRQARASLSSTGFSGRSAVEVEEMGITLSPTQRRLARENGISYREYASLLGDVPSGDRLKKNR